MKIEVWILLIILAILVYILVDSDQAILSKSPALLNALHYFDAYMRPEIISVINPILNSIITWIHQSTAQPINLNDYLTQT